jgi:alpha-galactosidase
VADPSKFPNGMKWLADQIHALGFGFGMYSSAGTATCAGYPASLGHETQDAATFASWGVDYRKSPMVLEDSHDLPSTLAQKG